MSGPVERGPNYDWKHEAEHYREECDKLRTLLGKVEASAEREAERVSQLETELAKNAGLYKAVSDSDDETIDCLTQERDRLREALLPIADERSCMRRRQMVRDLLQAGQVQQISAGRSPDTRGPDEAETGGSRKPVVCSLPAAGEDRNSVGEPNAPTAPTSIHCGCSVTQGALICPHGNVIEATVQVVDADGCVEIPSACQSCGSTLVVHKIKLYGKLKASLVRENMFVCDSCYPRYSHLEKESAQEGDK